MTSECTLCTTGYAMPNRTLHGGAGYRLLKVNGKNVLAHRKAAADAGIIDGFNDPRKVRHTCDNRQCINPDHLLAGSQQENLVDRSLRAPRNRSTLKLVAEQVLEVRRRMAAGETPTALAPEYGVSPENLMMIRSGQTWRHLL